MFRSTALCENSTARLSDLQYLDTQTDIKNCSEIKKTACSRDQTLSQMAASVEVWEMKRAFAIDVHLL